MTNLVNNTKSENLIIGRKYYYKEGDHNYTTTYKGIHTDVFGLKMHEFSYLLEGKPSSVLMHSKNLSCISEIDNNQKSTPKPDYMSGTINGCRIILAIKFQYASYNESLFICTIDQLARILKEYGTDKGIEFIKKFDPQKLTFKRVSKTQLLKWVEMETELHIYLSNHYYFR